MRSRLKRLERAARGEMIEIAQKDSTVARFPQSAGVEAFTNWFDRLGAGENALPEHPMLVAVRNSSDPYWHYSVYAGNDPEAHTKPIPDLSE